MWTICLLRDPHIQTLLIQFLAARLVQLNKPITVAPNTAGGGGTSGGHVATIATTSSSGSGSAGTSTSPRYLLPHEDSLIRLTTQLCGQALSTEFALCALDQDLIHYSLPTILLGGLDMGIAIILISFLSLLFLPLLSTKN